MKKLLICGDSFAADWTVKYPGQGWPNLLSDTYAVTNLAQAGCSEYKIYLQLSSVDQNDFDAVLISHTSPNRIYIKNHPVHSNDPLHRNADLIYTDIESHAANNKSLTSIVDFYKHYFDLDYAVFVHNLICEKIADLTVPSKTLHMTNLPWHGLYNFPNMLNFEYLFNKHRGLMNHYNDQGNKIIHQAVLDALNQ